MSSSVLTCETASVRSTSLMAPRTAGNNPDGDVADRTT